MVHPSWIYCNGLGLLNQYPICDEILSVRDKEQTSLATGLFHSPLT